MGRVTNYLHHIHGTCHEAADRSESNTSSFRDRNHFSGGFRNLLAKSLRCFCNISGPKQNLRKLVEMEISEHRNASSLGRIRKNLSLSSMNPLKSSDALSLCIKQRTAEINSFPPVARPLPPPQHYPKRSSKASYLTATIAIRFPYRIVDASLDLCARLQVSVTTRQTRRPTPPRPHSSPTEPHRQAGLGPPLSGASRGRVGHCRTPDAGGAPAAAVAQRAGAPPPFSPVLLPPFISIVGSRFPAAECKTIISSFGVLDFIKLSYNQWANQQII